jgi:hypothetical protein
VLQPDKGAGGGDMSEISRFGVLHIRNDARYPI